MLRSYIPYILAAMGLPIIFFTSISPLFEWQIGEITSDLPSSYDIGISPSPWKAYIGDSLDDQSYVSQKIYVSKNGEFCLKRDVNFVVKRSQSEAPLERLSLLPHLNRDTLEWVL